PADPPLFTYTTLFRSEDEQKAREHAFRNYQINPQLISLAEKDALFMHCLPAHRGEEVSADMMEHTSSVVWHEAENRLHAQKALLDRKSTRLNSSHVKI